MCERLQQRHQMKPRLHTLQERQEQLRVRLAELSKESTTDETKAEDLAFDGLEPLYRIAVVAKAYDWHRTTAWRHFRHLEGVHVKYTKTKSRRPKALIRIPESVVIREWLAQKIRESSIVSFLPHSIGRAASGIA
jgi:hypothetical protein